MKPGVTLNRLLGIVPKHHRTRDVLAIVAHGEKWIWIYDAGMISHKVRQIACERKHKEKK